MQAGAQEGCKLVCKWRVSRGAGGVQAGVQVGCKKGCKLVPPTNQVAVVVA